MGRGGGEGGERRKEVGEGRGGEGRGGEGRGGTVNAPNNSVTSFRCP